MAKKRDAKREGFWRRALRRRAKSGMTITEFCASEDLKPTAYHYWQREIKRRDEEESQSQDMAVASVSDPQLVPVQLVDDRLGTAAVEIVAKNGLVIRVSEQASSEHLRRVLQAVAELS